MTVDQEIVTDATHLAVDNEIIDAVVGEAEEDQDDNIDDDENNSDPEDEGNIKTIGEALKSVCQLCKFLADDGIDFNLDEVEDRILIKSGGKKSKLLNVTLD